MKNSNLSVSEIFASHTPIERALRKGVVEALLRHAALGESVVEWRDGKVVRVRPEQIRARLREAGVNLPRPRPRARRRGAVVGKRGGP